MTVSTRSIPMEDLTVSDRTMVSTSRYLLMKTRPDDPNFYLCRLMASAPANSNGNPDSLHHTYRIAAVMKDPVLVHLDAPAGGCSAPPPSASLYVYKHDELFQLILSDDENQPAVLDWNFHSHGPPLRVPLEPLSNIEQGKLVYITNEVYCLKPISNRQRRLSPSEHREAHDWDRFVNWCFVVMLYLTIAAFFVKAFYFVRIVAEDPEYEAYLSYPKDIQLFKTNAKSFFNIIIFFWVILFMMKLRSALGTLLDDTFEIPALIIFNKLVGPVVGTRVAPIVAISPPSHYINISDRNTNVDMMNASEEGIQPTEFLV